MFVLTFLLAALTTFAFELKSDNWFEMTTGKTIFVAYMMDWLHDNELERVWDQLMEVYKRSEDVLVAQIDCTAEGEKLCSDMGIEQYNKLMYGAPDDLQEYVGLVGFDELLMFARENLGPGCGPENMDLCTDEHKAIIEALKVKGLEAIETEINEFQEFMVSADDKIGDEIDKLQEEYQKLEEEKNEAVAAAMGEDFFLLQEIQAFLEENDLKLEL